MSSDKIQEMFFIYAGFNFVEYFLRFYWRYMVNLRSLLFFLS